MKLNIRNWIALSAILLLYITIIIIVITVIIRISNEEFLMNIFIIIFKLFTNVVTAAVTYFFTSKIVNNGQKLEIEKNGE